MKKKYLFYGSIFLFFLFILFLSPLSGDDWGNYLVGKRGIYHSIGNAVGMYFSWEGRFISRVFINILTYHKVLWNIINSLVITSSIFFINRIIKPKNKIIIPLLSLFLFLGMNLFTFSQVIVWIAGNITYLFVIPILLYYFYRMFINNSFSTKEIVLLSILNFIATMFIEHMAIILIVSNIFFLIYYYIKNKKIDKIIILYLSLSIIGTLIMFLSPGTRLRSGMENEYFNSLSLFGKIIYNIPNFIYYTFISNYFLLIILIISTFYLVKNIINNKIIKIINYIFLLFPIFTFIGSITYFLELPYFRLFSNSSHYLNIIYYFLLIIDILILLIIDYKKSNNIKPLFFFVLGISCNAIMMLSPTWGYRTGFSTYLFMGISSLMIIDNYLSYHKIYSYLVGIINIVIILFFIVLYYSVHLQYMDNYKAIQDGIKNKDKKIVLYKYPSFVNCNINPENSYHLNKFRKYYNIDSNVEIVLLNNKWKYKLIYKK